MQQKILTNIVCLRKPNGNIPVEPVHKAGITLAVASPNSVSMHGTLKTQVVKLTPFARRNQIPGEFMICMGMSGNGFRINGTKTITVPFVMAVHGKKELAPIVSLVGEAGTVIPIPAARLLASAVHLRVVLPILGLDW